MKGYAQKLFAKLHYFKSNFIQYGINELIHLNQNHWISIFGCHVYYLLRGFHLTSLTTFPSKSHYLQVLKADEQIDENG